MMHEEIWLPKR